MRISVVIPTFNRVSMLQGALESVVTQKHPAHEIIVIDDGSTDGTRDCITRGFPQVRYVHQPRAGVSSARNKGIELAVNDWVAFLDSDDRWLPNKLVAQVRAITADTDFAICHTNEIWIRQGRWVNPRRRHAKSGGWIFRRCLPLCVISPSAVLVHKRIFGDVGLFDEDLPACEDYDLWLRICARYPVCYVAEPLVVKHGGHDDQLSRQYWGMDRFRVRALEKIISEDDLNAADTRAAVVMLVTKLRIVLCGAKKRNNIVLSDEYEGKLERYEALLQNLTESSMGIE
ncbi:MAG: glycosyltransferase [Gammaproteobacteria bacterium]|nr:glycosyltransferase [Gammaproteobacteria bacterium]